MAIHPVQIFSKGFAQWKQNVWVCAGIALVLFVPVIIAAVAGVAAIAALAKTSMVAAVVIGVILAAAWILAALLMGIAQILAVRQSRQGKPSVGASIKAAFEHIGRFLGTSLLSGLGLFGAALLPFSVCAAIGATVFPKNQLAGGIAIGLVALAGLWALVLLGVRWSMSSYACVLEKTGPVASLKRSFALVKGRFFPVAGVYALFLLLSIALMLPATIIAAVSRPAGEVLRVILQIAEQLLVTPLVVNVCLVLWDELKAAAAPAAAEK